MKVRIFATRNKQLKKSKAATTCKWGTFTLLKMHGKRTFGDRASPGLQGGGELTALSPTP